jgi:hypothetical protein
MWKTVLATFAIAACVGPAWGADREAAYQACRGLGMGAVGYVKCRVAAENRYGHPLRAQPDLVRLEQATWLVLADRLDKGEMSAAEYELEYLRLKEDTFARFSARLNARYDRLSRHLEAAGEYQRRLAADAPVIPMPPPNQRVYCVGTEFGGFSTLSCN